MSSSSPLLAIGERDGAVVLSFSRDVRECVLDAETARAAGEQLARSAYRAHYGHEPTAARSQISRDKRAHLVARATLMLRSMGAQGLTPERQARELVAMLVAEF